MQIKALRIGPSKRAVNYLTMLDVPGRDAHWRVRQAALAAHATAYRYTATLKAKNGNGGVDIKLAGFYMLTVGNLAVGNLKEAVEWGQASSIGNSSFKDGKKLVDEPNGFVFTYQMNDEANGTKYAPESHFYYFIEKDGAVYSVNDSKPMDAFSTPPEAYTEALARQVYGLVKASATAN